MNFKSIAALSLMVLMLAACGSRGAPAIPPAKGEPPQQNAEPKRP